MSTNEGNVTRVTVELIITGAYRDDSGSYECSVSNLLNTVTSSINLTVQCKLSMSDSKIRYLIFLTRSIKILKGNISET